MHKNAPKLEELKDIRKKLFAQESTDANMKKLHAVDSQIERAEKEQTDGKKETAGTIDAS